MLRHAVAARAASAWPLFRLERLLARLLARARSTSNAAHLHKKQPGEQRDRKKTGSQGPRQLFEDDPQAGRQDEAEKTTKKSQGPRQKTKKSTCASETSDDEDEKRKKGQGPRQKTRKSTCASETSDDETKRGKKKPRPAPEGEEEHLRERHERRRDEKKKKSQGPRQKTRKSTCASETNDDETKRKKKKEKKAKARARRRGRAPARARRATTERSDRERKKMRPAPAKSVEAPAQGLCPAQERAGKECSKADHKAPAAPSHAPRVISRTLEHHESRSSGVKRAHAARAEFSTHIVDPPPGQRSVHVTVPGRQQKRIAMICKGPALWRRARAAAHRAVACAGAG